MPRFDATRTFGLPLLVDLAVVVVLVFNIRASVAMLGWQDVELLAGVLFALPWVFVLKGLIAQRPGGETMSEPAEADTAPSGPEADTVRAPVVLAAQPELPRFEYSGSFGMGTEEKAPVVKEGSAGQLQAALDGLPAKMQDALMKAIIEKISNVRIEIKFPDEPPKSLVPPAAKTFPVSE